jgi:PKD repeat protein
MLHGAARFFALPLSLLLCLLPNIANAASDHVDGQVRVIQAEFHGSSHKIRTLPVVPDPQKARKIPLRFPPIPESRLVADPVVQTTTTATVPTTDLNNFLGVGAGFVGPAGAYTVSAAPPDTIGAVGSNHYIQAVNIHYAIFDKATHAVLAGPLPGNATWTGINHPCARTNDGDPVVLYDQAADRWIFTQLSYSEGVYFQCISVSKTADPTADYWLYAFDWGTYLNDYPKMGVWSDAYYLSTNDFWLGLLFLGPSACAIRRETMLNGQPTLMICYAASNLYSSLLPANLNGSTAPPAGSPGLFLSLGNNMVHLWRMTPNWSSANSTVVTRTDIPVAAFNRGCGQNCIPQPDTTQMLDVLGDRLMQPLVYRNFGTHSALVANHSVLTGSTTSVRWYEIRNPHGIPTVFQQGTFAPDSHHRWMGSVGMDKVGNIAVGYSVGGSDLYPSIRYTGREPGDPLGTLQTETTIVNGGGSQLPSLNRWGDYSGMSLDPIDDCTFWYTTEYLESSGTFNWSTRIALFKFPSCDGSGGGPPDAPTGLTATAATNTQINLSWTAVNGADTYSVYRSTTSGSGYSSIASGLTTTSHSDMGLSAGTYYYLVTALNGNGESGNSNESSATVPLPNPPPVANFTFTCTNLTCNFTDTSTDDNGITNRLWNFGDSSSSTDTNPSHTYASANTYNVTLTVTDTNGQTGSETKPVTVTAPPAFTLTVTGRKVKSQRFADLVWIGASTSTVDVFRNGVKITTTNNDGAYTDTVRRGGTYTYRVCNLGTTTCSNNAAVTF